MVAAMSKPKSKKEVRPKGEESAPGGPLGPGVQYAALPYRRADELEILLVTSRETRRWVIPKGWPMKGRKPHAAAAQEALEEAGVLGRIEKQPMGFYQYYKRLAGGLERRCVVQVFPLEVERQLERWPEQHERESRWFSADLAAAAVDEAELSDLIHIFQLLMFGEPDEGEDLMLAEARASPVLK